MKQLDQEGLLFMMLEVAFLAPSKPFWQEGDLQNI
jgi:hypothetical protein